ncbi:exosortase C-terminal domain/associated protein EpsI [Aquabacterium sp.]|uniref:exosortase C-terminal domain/associated protein EpsI n=1 Tax=Aquabacterium sp. TaxID=1872578 RepID=UPI0035AF4E9C
MSMYFKPATVKPVLLALAVAVMFGSVAAAEALRPRKFWSVALGEPNYEHIIPHNFGDWEELPYASRAIVDPVQAETLAKIYNETFARTFKNKNTGRILMLSIAYGRNQSTDTQLHTPEQCYPSQGFRVDERTEHEITTPYGPIKVVRLATTMGPRIEPLTFFVRVGDTVVRGSKERNLARLHMAVRGYLVDGMLYRVSEITPRNDSFDVQDQFTRDLLDAIGPEGRKLVIGSIAN